jgi:S-adenosylmethionine decarboxylase
MSGTPFEGTEKKFELVVGSPAPLLRELGEEYWRGIARRAGAAVLSRISSDRCDAYILSESSLFVFDRKAVMITCGRTRLHEAVLALLEDVPPETIRMLMYERKNEVFPHRQPTSFFDDVRMLGRRIPGRSYRFGHQDEHHLYLFQMDGSSGGKSEDSTFEILMYGLAPDVRDFFCSAAGGDTGKLRKESGVERILPGFEVDDHLFEPVGYSMNGLRGDSYFAVHVTPEDRSYASFETNHRPPDGDLEGLIARVLETFKPRAYDLVLFEQGKPAEVTTHGYRLQANVAQELDSGFNVRFLSLARPQHRVDPAIELRVP